MTTAKARLAALEERLVTLERSPRGSSGETRLAELEHRVEALKGSARLGKLPPLRVAGQPWQKRVENIEAHLAAHEAARRTTTPR